LNYDLAVNEKTQALLAQAARGQRCLVGRVLNYDLAVNEKTPALLDQVA
jgi:hypothetical protein